MNFIEANGTALRHDLQGEPGPTMVLIHEMGGMIENWDLVVPHLRPAFRVLRYDTRGCGLAAKIRGTLALDTLVEDLRALLDALAIGRKVFIAGCALGAATALAFAARHPARTAGVLAMSPALDIKPEDRSSRRAMLTTVLEGGMQSIAEQALAAGYPPLLRARDPARFHSFRARWLGNDPDSFVAHYHMLIDLDMRADIARVRCPTLGICATLDRFRPPEYVRRVLAPIPGVTFETIETSHHQTVATPDEIAAAMLRFVADHMGQVQS